VFDVMSVTDKLAPIEWIGVPASTRSQFVAPLQGFVAFQFALFPWAVPRADMFQPFGLRIAMLQSVQLRDTPRPELGNQNFAD